MGRVLWDGSSDDAYEPDTRAILLVDDIPFNRDLLERWIAAEGYRVYTAGSGGEALEVARRHRPAVIFLDILIPPPNGFEVCERLKKRRETARSRVVLMTGLQHPQNSIRGSEVGCDGFLTKPFSRGDVRTMLRLALASAA